MATAALAAFECFVARTTSNRIKSTCMYEVHMCVHIELDVDVYARVWVCVYVCVCVCHFNSHTTTTTTLMMIIIFHDPFWFFNPNVYFAWNQIYSYAISVPLLHESPFQPNYCAWILSFHHISTKWWYDICACVCSIRGNINTHTFREMDIFTRIHTTDNDEQSTKPASQPTSKPICATNSLSLPLNQPTVDFSVAQKEWNTHEKTK